MKFIVTGGLGFIGTNLILQLLQNAENQITIIDNYSNVSETVDYSQNKNVTVIDMDIRDRNGMRPYFRECDAVVHLAAHTRVIESIEDPTINFDINVQGTFNILELMRENDINTLINASTGGAIIGEAAPPVHEEMIPRPSSPYGASKLFAEGYCSAYAQSYGINSASLRFSNIYGPHSKNKGSVVAAFLKDIAANKKITVYGDGTQTRDYLYVEDLANGIVAAIENRVIGVYQLGSGKGTSINELIEIIRSVIDVDFEVDYKDFRQGEILHTFCNISKAKAGFGFNPSIELQEGIRNTYSWFKKQKLI